MPAFELFRPLGQRSDRLYQEGGIGSYVCLFCLCVVLLDVPLHAAAIDMSSS